jgi:hypothetical protein
MEFIGWIVASVLILAGFLVLYFGMIFALLSVHEIRSDAKKEDQ